MKKIKNCSNHFLSYAINRVSTIPSLELPPEINLFPFFFVTYLPSKPYIAIVYFNLSTLDDGDYKRCCYKGT
jgi:hypothetical protein